MAGKTDLQKTWVKKCIRTIIKKTTTSISILNYSSQIGDFRLAKLFVND